MVLSQSQPMSGENSPPNCDFPGENYGKILVASVRTCYGRKATWECVSMYRKTDQNRIGTPIEHGDHVDISHHIYT